MSVCMDVCNVYMRVHVRNTLMHVMCACMRASVYVNTIYAGMHALSYGQCIRATHEVNTLLAWYSIWKRAWAHACTHVAHIALRNPHIAHRQI